MRHYEEEFHVLEVSTRGQVWHAAEAGMYREAYVLAYQGDITQAIESAERLHIENYGDMHNVDFRVVTKTKRVSCKGAMTEFRML